MSGRSQARLENDNYCFACGRDNPHGLAMRIQYQGEQALCRISLDRRFQGWAGMAHGGVVGTLLDEVMAYAVLRWAGLGVTASMETRYLKPVPIDSELEVRGWISERRGRLALTEAVVCRAGQDQPLARARAKFLVQSPGPDRE